MADVNDSHRDENALLQMVTFKIGHEEFGVEILKVQEIIRMMTITKVPSAPAFMEGVINLRGQVIPVIDLRTRFHKSRSKHNEHTRIMVMDLQGQTMGFVVDAVCEVLRIKESTVEAPPAVVAGVGSEYLRGVGKLQDRLLILLDLDMLFNEGEMESITGKNS